MLIEALLPRGERLTRRTLAGLAIGFVGIVVLVWPELTLGGDEGRHVHSRRHRAADCLSGLGARHVVHEAQRDRRASPLGAAAMQMLLSGVMLMAIGTATGEWSVWRSRLGPRAR